VNKINKNCQILPGWNARSISCGWLGRLWETFFFRAFRSEENCQIISQMTLAYHLLLFSSLVKRSQRREKEIFQLSFG